MALQRIPGVNNHWLGMWPPTNLLALGSLLLDAAADRITMIGRFTHQDAVSKTVDGVEFLLGAVAKTGGSTLQVSLQDVDAANGPVLREDGTPDQTLTIANADAGFVTDAWYGGDFTAGGSRVLAIGELVAVVVQFGTFVAGDTVNIRGITTPASGFNNQNAVVANLTGTYARQAVLANVVLRCTDGTFGTLHDAWPCLSVTQRSMEVNTTPDEYALGVQLPFPCATDGGWLGENFAGATAQTEVLLYQGLTALRTLAVDHNQLVANADQFVSVAFPPQTLAQDTLYRVGVRPLSATTQRIYTTEVNEAGHLTCLPGGANFHLWSRVNQGATWTALPTVRPFMGLRLSAFDDAAQTAAAQTIHTLGGRHPRLSRS